MKKFKIITGLFFAVLLLNSCTDDLTTEPENGLTLEELLTRDPNAVQGLVSKIYGSFALSGANGPGSTDTPGDDAGESPFLRGIINLEDFTADDMKNRWGDNGLDQLTTATDWDENNKFFRYLYNRVYYTVPQCNNLISVLGNVSLDNKEQYIAELRFLRSLAYYYLIDCFGKGVLVTEDTSNSVPAPQANRQQLFAFVESELLAIQGALPQTNEYGRANKAVARMLLAKLYLNAEVYTGTPKYAEALAQVKKVIDEGGYSLTPNFISLFSADNNVSSAKTEIIFPLIADPLTSQSYGNTTYLVSGSLSGDTMSLGDYGATEGWGGHRATSAWYGLFGASAADLAASSDDRAHLFWTTGHNYTMNNYKTWIDGYPSIKFRNTNAEIPLASATKFSGTDFPLFRLADAYLIYAECVLRGGGGSTTEALGYVNDIRNRSHATPINAGQLTLDFILDERARELNFEGHRRTDLIRFGKFTGGSYLWPWKGGVAAGTAIPNHYNVFPIPLKAMQANPNLTQNPGY
ncbi:MAG: RagB/SusD family nutrient uptake outer membrane protein [Bacteroidetes bacterium]|nr:RagB/SusD family nutrient uptake outer membrane protein [Bacteroidota bacterium]